MYVWTSLQRVSADTNYATPEPAANVIPLPSPLLPPTTSSPQLENAVDIPGYSEVPVNMYNERTHPLPILDQQYWVLLGVN